MIENYQGVKLGRQITDFVAGASSPLEEKIVNPSKNWDSYRPYHENQRIDAFETWACTIFSGTDCLETLFMYYIWTKQISAENLKWLNDKGYFNNGFINFSDRLPANFAEIEIGKGAYLYKANNALRKYLIPEVMLPFDTKNYYDKSKITQEMLDLAEEFSKRFTINWQWEDNENPDGALHKSPLQATVKYMNSEGILKPVGAENHAVMIYDDRDYWPIDDSYDPRDKKYGKGYAHNFVSYALTINNQKTLMNINKFLQENDLKFVRNTNNGAFGRVLRGKLRVVKTTDRAALLLLDNEHRKNGVNVTDAEWKELPKEDF